MQVDLDGMIDVLTETERDAALDRLEQLVTIGEEAGLVTGRTDETTRTFKILRAYEQIDIAHGAILARVGAHAIKRGALERDERNAGGTPSGIQTLEQVCNAAVTKLRLMFLCFEKLLPARRPMPSQAIGEERRGALHDGRRFGNPPLELCPSRRLCGRNGQLTREQLGRLAQGGLQHT